MIDAQRIIAEAQQLGDAKIAEHSGRFFKSGPGEYGEGDKFIGIRVPVVRELAKLHKSASLKTISVLLESEWHEIRLLALVILSEQFKKADAEQQKVIFDFYLSRTHLINNWDLIDSSAHHIVGGYLTDKKRDILYSLAESSSLWERRIAMMATFPFIRNNQFDDTIKLAEKLLQDKEDLIHKMCGWMLRELGKRDLPLLRTFLDRHGPDMPRTMLRYAIEKMSTEERKHYLAVK
ncbi:DNA alkylation repair protein [Grimontia kaedaensis]|uniref:DNA alkylation repair protein n=1 Tax=Grimontia kaedaensis TaxID=2872157 RepID=A0ABY4WR03_9GAMM|nr:DNA alkylation repair protein [Grimontia kaedaensis]USH01480.1 DNA alkylation repair protein [Grimontia kaedaensis]